MQQPTPRATTVVMQQPTPRATTVVTQQPTSSATTMMQQGQGGLGPFVPLNGNRDWSTGLFESFSQENSSCLTTFCCIPFTICYLSKRMGEHLLMPYFYPGAGVVAMRTKIRIVGGIRGTILGDCCTTMWCSECAIRQLEREMDAMNIK